MSRISQRKTMLAAVAGLAVAALAEAPPASEINLFGDGLVRKVEEPKDGTAPPIPGVAPARPADYPHVLVFHDGRQLSGQVVSLIGDFIILRRPDASEPLRFSRDEVRRVVFARSANTVPSQRGLVQPGVFQVDGANLDSPSKPAPATIKLPGTDWLFGEVTSEDGKTFEVKAGENSTFTIARSQVEWLYFAARPAPATGLSPNQLSLEPWLANAPQAGVTIEGGTVELRKVPWIARSIFNAPRIEVAFTVPADADGSLRLWLQPYSMAPNSYSAGTVNLQFGAKQISRTSVINGLNTERAGVPEDSPRGDTIAYRVFYDSQDARLFVLRNGQRLGDWSGSGEVKMQMAGGTSRAQPINYLLFDQQTQSENATFRFNRVRVQPWNGLMPGAASRSEDLLSFAIGASLGGKLQSISPTEIRIDGRTCPRDAGTFIELQPTTGGLDDAEALLSFGVNGEVGAAGLEIREGRVRCRTSFAPAFEMPVAALQTIAFSRRAGTPEEKADRLIFKSGDELEGALLAAGTGQRLRWRMLTGQELEFEPDRVAGVRRGVKDEPAEAPEAAAFEFRNGDCLSGRFIALDERQVRLAHLRLGELTIDREQLWNLYPRRDFAPVSAGARPGSWLQMGLTKSGQSPFGEDRQSKLEDWIYLDAKFVPRVDAANSGIIRARMVEAPTLPASLKRYELRFDCTCAQPVFPVVGLHLATQDGNAWVRANLYGGQLAFYQQTRAGRGLQNWRRMPAAENPEFRSTRASFRVLVDTERGTAAVSVNGSKLATMSDRGKDRAPGVGEKVQISVGGNGIPHVLSNVWIAPWNGEESAAGAVGPTTVFANGDVSAGEPGKFSDGRFHLESEAGLLEVPAERIAAVRFRGEPSTARAPGRVRLYDGSVINVESFRWNGSELTGRGVNIGDFRLAAEDVRELVFDPDEAGAPDAAPASKPGPEPGIDPAKKPGPEAVPVPNPETKPRFDVPKPAKPGVVPSTKQRIASP